MKLRDIHATINGDDEVFNASNGGIEILSDRGHVLFVLSISRNVLTISGGNVCMHNGVMLDDRFVISPIASNCVNLIKTEY